jgi:hypothetical protein
MVKNSCEKVDLGGGEAISRGLSKATPQVRNARLFYRLIHLLYSSLRKSDVQSTLQFALFCELFKDILHGLP